jgi:hypothetical protein
LIEKALEGKGIPDASAQKKLAMPFKVCWFELSENAQGQIPFVAVDSPAWNGDTSYISQLGMLVKETAPNEYDLFCLEIDQNKRVALSVFRHVKDFGGNGEHEYTLGSPLLTLKFWLNLLSKGVLGVQEVEEVVHIPRADRIKKTKPHHINRIIHISASKNSTSPSGQHRNIDWSHRWEVRGHWRRLDADSIGKDRDGNYVVAGWTWVTPHEKGDPSLPLIIKDRSLKV